MQKTVTIKIIIIVSIVIFVSLGLYFIYKNQTKDVSNIRSQESVQNTAQDIVQNTPKITFSFVEFAPRTKNGEYADVNVVDTEIFLEGTEQISSPFHNSTNEFDDTAKFIEQFYEKNEKQIQVDKSWNEVLSLQADGPGSSQTGYRRINSTGQTEYIIFSYHTVHERDVPDGPSECPCTTVFKIFKGVQIDNNLPKFIFTFIDTSENGNNTVDTFNFANQPHSKVELEYGSKKYNVGTYYGSCTAIEPDELAVNEISGVSCWFAGSGDELRLVKTNGVYQVKHREIDSGSADIEGYVGEYIQVLEVS